MKSFMTGKKILQLFVLIIISQLIISCDFGYKKDKNKVYYKYWNSGMGIETRTFQIPKADYKTFEKLKFDCDCSFDFAKDKNHLYIDGYTYNNVDPKSFKFVGNYLFKDKDSAYFFGFYNDFNDCSIKGIDINKIQLLEYPWAKSGNVLIHGKDTLILNDINDFVVVDKDWGKTKKSVIHWNKIVPNANPETFKFD